MIVPFVVPFADRPLEGRLRTETKGRSSDQLVLGNAGLLHTHRDSATELYRYRSYVGKPVSRGGRRELPTVARD